jgi:hypothetical protein
MKNKTIKNVGTVIKSQEFLPKHKEKYLLNLIQKNAGDGYLRQGNFSNEIVWDGKSYLFSSKAKNDVGFKKGLFLFGMVRKDAKNFLKTYEELEMPTINPVNDYNEKFNKFEQKITGTDLNHAYWRIAFNLGIIRNETYIKGLDDDFKTVRLSALSTLGKGKDYYVIKNGKITNEVVKIGTDEAMDNLYKVIRFTCYEYMNVIKEMLKDDFVCYRTDCVYYVDTKENRKLVRDYFKNMNMSFKQLYVNKKTLHEQGFSKSKK